MAEITNEWVKEQAAEVMTLFEDGFQWSDVFKAIPKAMEITERVGGLTGAEKKEAAVKLINHVIDETDTPWVPDAIVDPILKKAAPFVIELLVDATKGRLAINQPSGEADGAEDDGS